MTDSARSFQRATFSRVSAKNLAIVVTLVGAIWIVATVILHHKLSDYLNLTNKDTVETLVSSRAVYAKVICNETIVTVTDRKCAKRLRFLMENQRSNCFKNFGVPPNASECTVLGYLVYTERVCPELELLEAQFQQDAEITKSNLFLNRKISKANGSAVLEGILLKMLECGDPCKWMKHRIESMRYPWTSSIKEFFSDKLKSAVYGERRKRTILLHMGLLADEIGLNFGVGAFIGGPLGELVQWADLIVVLHLLGHNVVLSWSRERLKKVLFENDEYFSSCKRAVVADLVFTDLNGLEQMTSILGTIHHYRCRLRILDVFGTEPEFNHPRYYAKINSNQIGWGGKGLDPRQFFTLFPHTPDNSFLGFVVQKASKPSDKEHNSDRCLLYGKQSKYLNELLETGFLDILHRHFPDIHTTMKIHGESQNLTDYLPDYVTNHGPLAQDEFTKLLRSSSLYVGLGWPVEGPAALEAVANGVIFLNRRFSPPIRAHYGKPTNRTLTSQNPYAEVYIGEPFVHTVDYQHTVELERILHKIRDTSLNETKVNYEFTHSGFVEIKESFPDESCVSACFRYNFTCDRTFFPHINDEHTLRDLGYHWASVKNLQSSMKQYFNKSIQDFCHAPSYDLLSGTLVKQSDPLLFSCACVPPSSVIRFCPCRTFKLEQTAMCLHCI